MKTILLKIAVISACVSVSYGGAPFKKELSNFYLPDRVIAQDSLKNVLADYLAAYRKMSERTGHEAVDFDFVSEGDWEKKVGGIKTSGKSLVTLQILALQAGMKLDFQGNKVHLKPIPADRVVSEVKYPVAPDFLLQATQILQSPWVDGGGERNAQLRSELAKKAMLDRGILADRNTDLKLLTGASTLVVKGTGHEQARMKIFLNSMAMEFPVQVRVMIKVVRCPKTIQPKTGYFSDKEAQKWMRSLSKKKDVALTTIPYLLVRPKKSAELEVIRQFRNFDEDQFLGLRLNLKTGTYGRSLQLDFNYVYHFLQDGKDERHTSISVEGSNPGDSEDITRLLRAASDTGKKLNVKKLHWKDKLLLKRGQYWIGKVDGQSQRDEYLILTANLIDAAGCEVTTR